MSRLDLDSLPAIPSQTPRMVWKLCQPGHRWQPIAVSSDNRKLWKKSWVVHYGTSSRGNLINIDCHHCWRRSVRFETRLNHKHIILFRSIPGRAPGIRFVCRPPSICVDFPILHFALEWNFPLWPVFLRSDHCDDNPPRSGISEAGLGPHPHHLQSESGVSSEVSKL